MRNTNVPEPLMVASPKMSAVSRLELHVTALMSIEWTSRLAGLSEYCSCPLGAPAWSVCTVPPKLTLSPLFATIQPPLVMSMVQSGLLTGRTHSFVAVPQGGPEAELAQPLITSAAGRMGPGYVKVHDPLGSVVVQFPVLVTATGGVRVTVKKTLTPPIGLPNWSRTVAVTV